MATCTVVINFARIGAAQAAPYNATRVYFRYRLEQAGSLLLHLRPRDGGGQLRHAHLVARGVDFPLPQADVGKRRGQKNGRSHVLPVGGGAGANQLVAHNSGSRRARCILSFRSGGHHGVGRGKTMGSTQINWVRGRSATCLPSVCSGPLSGAILVVVVVLWLAC
ncbi:hypothetical protein [Hymenobacter sp. YC55]|uniref:hypothetical protein n=1 Tax=Hymenobacter sp. YC55 TaxID=3034019 RepID=UPI0023F64EC3|nr:hypothetical protein [Hymenobacter sp. YC55]MDF7815854.1 hypothetical protein [Hymenobacter sp. YC55]